MHVLRNLIVWVAFWGIGLCLATAFTTSTAWGQAGTTADGGALQPANAPQSTTAVANEDHYWRWSLLQTNDTGNWEIILHRYDEVNFPQYINLTNHPARDVEAKFNYGAQQIVFVSDRDTTKIDVPNTELYLMDTDGAQLQRLTNNPLRDEMPEWSPSGMEIVYSSEHEDGMEIYLINHDGTGRRRLTNRAGNDWFPTWSPDGQQILWMSQGVNTGQLWIMQADGSNQRPLTDVLPFLGRARWSPDGRYIVFSYLSRPEEAVNLGIVNSDGANLHEVRCPTAYVHVGFTVGAWTPDGESLLVTQYRPQEVNTAPENVVTMVHLTNGVCDNNSLDLYHNLSSKLLTDMTRADPWPPVSALAPVLPYTRLPDLILQLSGQDVGRSGLLSYDVHYRMADDGDWKQGEDHMPAIVVLRPPTTGSIALRSRARDVAGNEEAWPTAPETSTLLYRSLLQGQYTDQRGIPLADQAIAIGPTPLEEGRSDFSGAFRVHIGGVNYTVNSTMRLPTDSDWTRDLYRIPAGNLLANGTFEASSLTGWQTSGNLAPQIDQDVVYNGIHSLRLGAACVGVCPPSGIPEFIPQCIPNVMPGCVDPEAAFPPNYALSTVRFFADSNDNLHFIGNTSSGDILYQHGQSQGTWDRPIILDSTLDLGSLRGVVQTNGDLHLVWSSSEGKLYYRKRSNNGTWSSSREIGSGAAPEIAIDSKGLIHLLYTSVQPHQSEEQSLHYRQQNADGSWSASTDLARYLYNYLSLPVLYHTIAITADDRVHFVWDKPEGESWAQAFRLVYKVREANGRWGGEASLGMSSAIVESLQLLATGRVLHLLWQQDGTGFYARYVANQGWIEAEQIGRFMLATADTNGTLHLVQSPTEGTTSHYRAKPLDAPWSDRVPFEPPQFQASLITIQGGHATAVHALWSVSSNSLYYAIPPLTQTLESQIQQRVTIPAPLHRPTLSFFYALDGTPTNSAYFDVTVGNGITNTQVFSATEITPWSLGWADLTAWQGKNITITFRTQQAIGDLPIRVHVDDIAVTSWQTAVPHGFAPRQVEPGVAATLVITGENFIDIPLITVEGIPLVNVQQIDDNTLHAQLPSTLRPGRYHLWVRNPESTERTYAGQIQVGTPLYLPIITR